MSLFDLGGRTAVVSGASSGIGRAMAQALAGAGAHVVGLGRDAGRLAELHDAGVADVVAVDLATTSGVAVAVRDIDARVGRVDVLVNAAGTNPRPPFDEQGLEAWRAVLAVNLDAPFLLGRHFGPRMAARGWGRIVNVGSQQQHRAFGHSGAYGVAKAGLAGLTRSQSEAWAPAGVCVNTVVPGLVDTAMTKPLLADPERAAYFAERSHAKRIGTPTDFAGIAVFLASEASGFVTGQAICVDGGLSVT